MNDRKIIAFFCKRLWKPQTFMFNFSLPSRYLRWALLSTSDCIKTLKKRWLMYCSLFQHFESIVVFGDRKPTDTTILRLHWWKNCKNATLRWFSFVYLFKSFSSSENRPEGLVTYRLFEDMNLCAIHAKRMTIIIHDSCYLLGPVRPYALNSTRSYNRKICVPT